MKRRADPRDQSHRPQQLNECVGAPLTGPPPAPTKITRVYYDRVLCRRQTWDIYRVDDFERLPPARLRH